MANRGQRHGTRVFLSYSRKDVALATNLRDRLIEEGFDAYLDLFDIEKGEAWQERLQDLIVTADAVAFLISPDSVTSKVCDWEVNEAERLGKRLFPILCRPTPDDVVPGRLKRLNYARLDEDDAWVEEFPKFCQALRRDGQWLREHARLSEAAERWVRDSRSEAHLLRLESVRTARKWESRRPPDASVGDVLLEFLEASEALELRQRKHLLTTIGRAFVKPARQALAQGQHDVALRLSAAGTLLADDFEMRLVPEREFTLLRAAREQLLRCVIEGQTVSFDSNGQRVTIVGKDGRVRLHDPATGLELSALEGGEASALNAWFSRDGAHIIAVGRGGVVCLWNANSLQVRNSVNCDGASISAICPQGAWAISVKDRIARAWDLGAGKQWGVLGQNDVVEARFDFQGSRAATSHHDYKVRLWDCATWRETAALVGHSNHIGSVAFSSTEDLVATTSWDGSARLWRGADGRALHVLEGHAGSVVDAAFSPDGTRLATAGNDNTIRVWDVSDGRELCVISAEYVHAVAFSPDGQRLVSTCHYGAVDVWSAASGEKLAAFRGYAFGSAVFNPDGTRIATASVDGAIRIWDSATRDALGFRPRTPNTISPLWIGDNVSRVVTASADDNIARVWENGREIAFFKGHELPVVAAIFDAEGERIVSASMDCTARICSIAQGASTVLRGHEAVVRGACFSSNGRLVATFSNDGSARVWDAETGSALLTLDGRGRPIAGAAFDPTDMHIFTFADHVVTIWDAQTGCRRREIEVAAGLVKAISISDDNARIAIANGQVAQIIEIATGREIARLSGHNAMVTGVCFSPDGRSVATSGGDKTARIWDASTGRELAVMRGHSHALQNAVFHRDGALLFTEAFDGVRAWEVAHVAALIGDPIEVLAASLTSGRGQRAAFEENDLLMQSAPNDLYAALMDQLTAPQRERVIARAQILSEPQPHERYVPLTAAASEASMHQGSGMDILAKALPVEDSSGPLSSSEQAARRSARLRLFVLLMAICVIAFSISWLILSGG